MSKLICIKLIHTNIWLFFNVIILYLAYAVITNKLGLLAWIGIGIILTEGIVLLIFKNICPVTTIARKYSDSTKDNFDIFLPNWLAKYNKLIYTTIFILFIFKLIYNIIAK